MIATTAPAQIWRHVRPGAAPAGGQQDHPVRAQLQQRLQGMRLRVAVSVARGDQHLVAGRCGRRCDPVNDLGEERVVQVRCEHADVEGAALDQASGNRVGTVPQLFGGYKHRVPALAAHRAGTAQHA